MLPFVVVCVRRTRTRRLAHCATGVVRPLLWRDACGVRGGLKARLGAISRIGVVIAVSVRSLLNHRDLIGSGEQH